MSEPDVDPRTVLRQAEELHRRAARLVAADEEAAAAVQRCYDELRDEQVRHELAKIPLTRLRDGNDGRLRLGVLEKAGYRTVSDVHDAPLKRLLTVPGVGQQTAKQAMTAAREVAAAVGDSVQVRLNPDRRDQRSTALLTSLRRYEFVSRAVAPSREVTQRTAKELPGLLATARPASSRVRMFFSGGRRKQSARDALARVNRLLDRMSADDTTVALDRALDALDHPPRPAAQVWTDFQRRAAEYYGLLGEVVELKQDVEAAEGFLPADVVANVNEQRLDATHLRVALRGYQSFGARFALVQRRVILGDEMGLGKTIQAIAAIAHLKADGATHFLVVCPASVLINWVREVEARSTLAAYRLHGSERNRNLESWIRRGDVAVTTYEALRGLELPAEVAVSMLVVDEAHYIKNPAAQRSRHTARWTARAERVLFLTGTPMENRADEFKNLVAYLRPDVAARLGDRLGVAGPDAFRTAVAPVYLRRNQEDVLTELPELVQVDEWEEFSAHDLKAYRRAVLDGNFMAMRRAAFASADPAKSAKLQRLLEIADEAGANGHKVVVFSYFRAVLTTVHAALGPPAFGPLTGDMPPVQRQALLDEFTAADRPQRAGQPDPGRRRRPQHAGGVDRHPVRTAGEADDRVPGDRAGAPDGAGADRPGAPAAHRRQRRPADARDPRQQVPALRRLRAAKRHRRQQPGGA